MKYVLTYGIACINEEKGMRELVLEISSLTTDMRKAERLVKHCNDRKLLPEHLYDVIDDLLEE